MLTSVEKKLALELAKADFAANKKQIKRLEGEIERRRVRIQILIRDCNQLRDTIEELEAKVYATS